MYWKCQYQFSDGHKEWKMLSSKTAQRAFRKAFEVGRWVGAEPLYETLIEATKTEVSNFRKELKKRINDKMNDGE